MPNPLLQTLVRSEKQGRLCLRCTSMHLGQSVVLCTRPLFFQDGINTTWTNSEEGIVVKLRLTINRPTFLFQNANKLVGLNLRWSIRKITNCLNITQVILKYGLQNNHINIHFFYVLQYKLKYTVKSITHGHLFAQFTASPLKIVAKHAFVVSPIF